MKSVLVQNSGNPCPVPLPSGRKRFINQIFVNNPAAFFPVIPSGFFQAPAFQHRQLLRHLKQPLRSGKSCSGASVSSTSASSGRTTTACGSLRADSRSRIGPHADLEPQLRKLMSHLDAAGKAVPDAADPADRPPAHAGWRALRPVVLRQCSSNRQTGSQGNPQLGAETPFPAHPEAVRPRRPDRFRQSPPPLPSRVSASSFSPASEIPLVRVRRMQTRSKIHSRQLLCKRQQRGPVRNPHPPASASCRSRRFWRPREQLLRGLLPFGGKQVNMGVQTSRS